MRSLTRPEITCVSSGTLNSIFTHSLHSIAQPVFGPSYIQYEPHGSASVLFPCPLTLRLLALSGVRMRYLHHWSTDVVVAAAN